MADEIVSLYHAWREMEDSKRPKKECNSCTLVRTLEWANSSNLVVTLFPNGSFLEVLAHPPDIVFVYNGAAGNIPKSPYYCYSLPLLEMRCTCGRYKS